MKQIKTQKDVYLAELPSTYNEETKCSTVEVLRTGSWDGMKGKFEITAKTLDKFVESFTDKIYETELQVNIAHNRQGEAAGWFKNLYRKGSKLFGDVEWTPLGERLLKDKIFRFFSSEIAFTYENEETGEKHDNVFMGGALTNIPYIRGLKPVMFSDTLEAEFTNESENMFDKKKFDEESDEEAEGKQEEAEGTEEGTEAKKVEAHDNGNSISLAEAEAMVKSAIAVQQRELSKMQADLRLRNATEEAKKFALSDTGKLAVGFAQTDLDELAKFSVELSAEQSQKFYAILSKMKAVDFTEYGVSTDGDTKEKVQKINGFAVDEISAKLDVLAQDYATTHKVSYAEAMLAVEDKL